MTISVSNKPVTYLTISIGPIYKTIQSAKKTRELWAASFLLSTYMKTILTAMENKKYGTCLSPDIQELGSREKHHGAGIWNDNCFYCLYENKLEEVKRDLPDLLQKAKVTVMAHVLSQGTIKRLGMTMSELGNLLDRHFYCTAVLHSRIPDQTDQEKVLIELGKLMYSAELVDPPPQRFDDYVSQVLFQPSAVLGLYKEGFDPYDTVFTRFEKGNQMLKRMPSLLEIATREFRDREEYGTVMEAISNLAKQENEKNPALDDAGQTDDLVLELTSGEEEEEAELIRILKSIREGERKLFKKRHKYIAIIQSDGDGIGNRVKNFEDSDIAGMQAFSRQLMAFSKEAVKQIADFDALPVYAGGDDLLFIAPLKNKKKETLFNLLDGLCTLYGEKMESEGQKPTLSFGVSISYYKYPLSEALDEGRKLLFKVAKKLRYSRMEGRILNEPEKPVAEKNAFAFRVLLHSGQAFGAVLRQDGAAWKAWKAMLDAAENADAAFLSGMVHRLENLGYLLEEACRHDTQEAFFKKHFNEAKGDQKLFVEKVRDLAKAIYAEYGALHIEKPDAAVFYGSQLHLDRSQRHLLNDPQLPQGATTLRQLYCNNLLYSALRFIQFLNADDHE